MQKKILFCLVLMLACVSLHAQTTLNVSDSITIKVSEDYYQHQYIQGNPYILILDRPMTGNGKNYKDTGHYYLINLETGDTLTSSKIDYTQSTVTLLRQGFLVTKMNIMSGAFKSKLYAFDNFKKEIVKWPIYPVYYDHANDIVIGYEDLRTDYLCGYSSASYKLMWKTALKHNSCETWNDVKKLNRETLFLSANGFCLLDVTTGQYVLHQAKTAITDVKTNASIVGLGLVTGLALGVFMVPLNNQITHLNSNLLKIEDNYYVSDRDGIYCMDDHLMDKWQIDVNKNELGYSHLYSCGDSLIILNSGFGLRKGKYTKCGKPFIAKYNYHTGEKYNQVYFNEKITMKELNDWDLKFKEKYGSQPEYVDPYQLESKVVDHQLIIYTKQ